MTLLQLGSDKAKQVPEGPPQDSPGGEISFSARALVEARKLLEREGGKLFRVGVSKGGCSGWNYEISMAQDAASDDKVFQFDGDLPVVMSPKAVELLFGMRINYKVSFQEQGFVFENPNAASTCGCGISFGV
jgi:iron-sulfur cluster assembly accessory protein